MSFKITYSTLGTSMDQIHKEFDQALGQAKKMTGKTYGLDLGAKLIVNLNPSDTREELGKFHTLPVGQLNQIFEQAETAQKSWGKVKWQERVQIIRRAAEAISENKFLYSAMTTLEVGKTRLEALGEVEEAADLLRYYALQMEESQGYTKPMLRLNPKEVTLGTLRPYGIFSVIAPFNFPVALAAGMAGAALLGGNSVVLKPSAHTPWSGEILHEVFLKAGLPEHVLQIVQGDVDLGQAMVKHPKAHGVSFTGSKKVGMEILQTKWGRHPRPVMMELGGKNPAIVTETANLDHAVEGCYRSAFGLSGQKCSALSRIYVHESIKDKFIQKLVAKTTELQVGDASAHDTFVGPVIHQGSLERYRIALGEAQSQGKIHFYNESLAQREELKHGNYVSPVIVEVSHSHRLMTEEHFLPFLCIDSYKDFSEALEKANDTEYGLTGGIYSSNKAEVEIFFNECQAGILYSNRSSGATTGAWPGVQPFCGWKGSGATGKGGCGPHYVAQFMREQSQTRMTE